MRLFLPGILSACLSLPLSAQYSETGESPPAPRAQPVSGDQLGDPGASQDAEAARERLLKAADQLDNIESNSEATKASLDGMKADLAKLSDDNTALKAQVSTLQDTVTRQQDQLDQIKADRVKERQALIDEVAALVAEKTGSPHAHAAAADEDSAPTPKKHTADDTAAVTKTAPLAPPPDASSGPVHSPPSGDDSSGPVKMADASAAADATPSSTPLATSHPHKGYYHVVAPHETLSLICEAYRDNGVNVTVAQIRHANDLGTHTPLKVGQKLFIPKPGT